MDKATLSQELEKEFLATVMGELMPGVLHNFANPLNGIMGRAKLLQRRLEDSIRKMEARYPGFAEDFGAEKVIRDVHTIAGESDRFFTLFRDLSDKFAALAGRDRAGINVAQLLEAEIRFADFYLDFKHDIQKHIQLDGNLPLFPGIVADFSLALGMLFFSAKERMKHAPLKEVSVTAVLDGGNILVVIEDSGEEISAAVRQCVAGKDRAIDFAALPQSDRGLVSALCLLGQSGTEVRISRAGGRNHISLAIPHNIKDIST